MGKQKSFLSTERKLFCYYSLRIRQGYSDNIDSLGIVFPSDEFFVDISTDIFLHLLNYLIISCKNNKNIEIRQINCTKMLNSDK